MFNTLYHYPRVLSRHTVGPLAAERSTFLSHLKSQGVPRSTLLRYARELRVVASLLHKLRTGPVSVQEIVSAANRWAQRQQRLKRARSRKWPFEYFVQVACAWCRYLDRLKEGPSAEPAHMSKLKAWASMLREEEDLAEITISNYCWWARKLLEWLNNQSVPLHRITPIHMDGFMKHLAAQGLNRVTIATAAKVLRRFLHYVYQQGWCRQNGAYAVLSPRLFREEHLPIGPVWQEVQRLIAATGGSGHRDVRNRAILLLLAVYALRSGEVRTLRLEDVDWARRILRVRRSKIARVHEYPLTRATGQALRRYLKEARPTGYGHNLFLTLRAPFRPLSESGMYALVRSLLDRLEIISPKRGPHALRHSCASFLLNSGLTLKQVGDHLGHRTPSVTQVYAKVDLAGLRAVAAFDLGGLL